MKQTEKPLEKLFASSPPQPQPQPRPSPSPSTAASAAAVAPIASLESPFLAMASVAPPVVEPEPSETSRPDGDKVDTEEEEEAEHVSSGGFPGYATAVPFEEPSFVTQEQELQEVHRGEEQVVAGEVVVGDAVIGMEEDESQDVSRDEEELQEGVVEDDSMAQAQKDVVAAPASLLGFSGALCSGGGNAVTLNHELEEARELTRMANAGGSSRRVKPSSFLMPPLTIMFSSSLLASFSSYSPASFLCILFPPSIPNPSSLTASFTDLCSFSPHPFSTSHILLFFLFLLPFLVYLVWSTKGKCSSSSVCFSLSERESRLSP